MAGEGEDVYCTLVMNDAYLPGAAVLAHSLRDAGSKKKLACLILQDGLSDSTIQELRSLYNYVIPIERLATPNPANLYLMNRPDLLYTFTKIALWRQTQFRKIVYVDADVVVLRAPEELFSIEEPFAAAPDVGWPDAFNTGVMVLSPNVGDYHALKGLANAGDSFDGADQGLLNQYFEHRPWTRLSFKYNVTPSAHYQYEPAYRYFKRDISMVHFIGSEKPWRRGRSAQGMSSAFQELLSRWWAVYDRHFHISTSDYIQGQRHPVSHYVQEARGDAQSQAHDNYSSTGYPLATTRPAPPPEQLPPHDMQYHQPQHQESHHGHGTATPLMTEPGEPAENIIQGYVEPAPTVEQRRFSAPHMEWDATRGAPPIESKPEAANFPIQTYEFNTDPEPFRPPPVYPAPPKDMWYSVPEQPKAEQKLQPIFPWEEREQQKPTRRFIEDVPLPPPPAPQPEPAHYLDELEVTSDDKDEPTTPTIRVHGPDPWAAFAQNKNAWDDVGGIENYVRALTAFQKNRGKVQVVQENVPSQQHVLSPSNEPDPEELIEKVRERRESLILTDFPTAVERPSLPVTPAPRRRPSFWGEERDHEGELPPAQGVPDQADWDPSMQLEQLRRSSLIGPSDLKMPERKLTKRAMPSTAVTISEEALNHPHVPIANRDDTYSDTTANTSTEAEAQTRIPTSGDRSFPGLDGASSSQQSFFSASDSQQSTETEVNTAINSSSSSLTFADKSVFAVPEYDKPGSVTMDGVNADEVDMKRAVGDQADLSPTQTREALRHEMGFSSEGGRETVTASDERSSTGESFFSSHTGGQATIGSHNSESFFGKQGQFNDTLFSTKHVENVQHEKDF